MPRVKVPTEDNGPCDFLRGEAPLRWPAAQRLYRYRPKQGHPLRNGDSTRDPHWVFLSVEPSFSACHLFRMKIQQDRYEPDRWWFAPLLYAGAAVLIAALVLA